METATIHDPRERPEIRRRAWIVWGLGAAFFCYGFFQRTAPSVMTEDLMRDFAVSAAALGNLSAFYFYAYASMQIPIGLSLDRIGPRRMMTGAAALCGLGSILFGLSHDLGLAQLGRLMVGLGAGFAWVGTLTLIGIWFPARRFATMVGVLVMLGMMGGVGGQSVLAVLIEAFGWRANMLVGGIFGVAIAVGLFLAVRDRLPNEKPAPPPMGGATWRVFKGLLSALRRSQTWLAAGVNFGMAVPVLAFGGLWSVPYLMQAYGLSRTEAGFSASLIMVGWACGGPVAGWLSDRIARRKAPMLGGSLLALATFSAMIYIPDLDLTAVRILLWLNGFVSGTTVLCFAVARECNSPNSAGSITGFVNMASMGAGAMFQPIIGLILDLNWDGTEIAGVRHYSVEAYHLAFLVPLLTTAFAVVMALLLRETHCRQDPSAL